jgi:hypothetical protein
MEAVGHEGRPPQPPWPWRTAHSWVTPWLSMTSTATSHSLGGPGDQTSMAMKESSHGLSSTVVKVWKVGFLLLLFWDNCTVGPCGMP